MKQQRTPPTRDLTMNENAAANILDWPHNETLIHKEEPKPSWWQKRLADVGVITMGHQEPKPPTGIIINFTSVLFYLTLIGTIAGGFWWAYQQGNDAGVKEGEAKEIRRQQQAQIDALRNELEVQRDALELKDRPKEKK